jgi:lysophospholipase L1-like esterase
LRPVGGLAIALALLAGAEALVRLLTPDPYPDLAFDFEDEDDMALRVHLRLLGELDQTPLPEGSFDIFFYGASTTVGHPLGAQYSFGHQLQAMLADVLPRRLVGIRFYANPGLSSWHVREAVEKTIGLGPDLLVICSGHNDLNESNLALLRAWEVRHSRTRRLRRAILLNSQIARWMLAGLHRLRPPRPRIPPGAGYVPPDDPYRRLALRAYKRNIRDCLRLARRADIPVVLVTLPANIRQWEPLMDPHAVPDAVEPQVQRVLHDLARAEQSGESTALAEGIEALRSLSPEHVALDYYQAHLALLEGRKEEARALFLRARDRDNYPIRAPGEVNAFLRGLADPPRVQVLDAAALFAANAPDGLPGYEWILDHVHPTPRGHLRIARALLELLRESDLVAPRESWQPRRIRGDTYYLARQGWTRQAQATRIMRTAEMHWITKHIPRAVELMIQALQLDPSGQERPYRTMLRRYEYLMFEDQRSRARRALTDLGLAPAAPAPTPPAPMPLLRSTRSPT